MTTLVKTVETIGYSFLGAAAAIVAGSLLTGRINMHGLLRAKFPSGAGDVSPARVQLLLATIGAAVTYLGAVLAARDSGRLPDMPALWLAGLGASNGVYLVTKAIKFLLPPGAAGASPQETP